MSKYNTDCSQTMVEISDIFPIEVDLPSTLIQHSKESFDDEDEESSQVTEKEEAPDNVVHDLIGIN